LLKGYQLQLIVVLVLLIGLTLVALLLLFYVAGNTSTSLALAPVETVSLPGEAQWSVTVTAVVIAPTATHTLTPTHTATPVTPSPTSTRTPTVTSTPITPLYTPVSFNSTILLPAEASVSGIVGHKQALSLSCEARAAVDWAAFFGVEISERQFQQQLPRSDNPDKGFVGDVNDNWGQIPPKPYGVHAGPVAVLLQQYGLDAVARYGMSWDDLLKEIAAGRPVIVWVIGHVDPGTGVTYIDHDGQQVIVAPYEHAVMVIGYKSVPENTVTILDRTRIYERSPEKFMRSWGVLGYMAITLGN
jgi:uncharacterized protein YvpB